VVTTRDGKEPEQPSKNERPRFCQEPSQNQTLISKEPELNTNPKVCVLSGVCGAGVEQSASTDQGRLVTVVFPATNKGPSVSAVVQLTSDYCLPSFLI